MKRICALAIFIFTAQGAWAFGANLLPVQQKIDYAKEFIGKSANAHGLRLVEGSLDLHTSNTLPHFLKTYVAALACSLRPMEGVCLNIEFVDFVVTDATHKKYSGWVYVFSRSLRSPDEETQFREAEGTSGAAEIVTHPRTQQKIGLMLDGADLHLLEM